MPTAKFKPEGAVVIGADGRVKQKAKIGPDGKLIFEDVPKSPDPDAGRVRLTPDEVLAIQPDEIHFVRLSHDPGVYGTVPKTEWEGETTFRCQDLGDTCLTPRPPAPAWWIYHDVAGLDLMPAHDGAYLWAHGWRMDIFHVSHT